MVGAALCDPKVTLCPPYPACCVDPSFSWQAGHCALPLALPGAQASMVRPGASLLAASLCPPHVQAPGRNVLSGLLTQARVLADQPR